MNPAFEYLRQFKKVSDESEELVMKVVKKRYPEISLNELVNIFEQRNERDPYYYKSNFSHFHCCIR